MGEDLEATDGRRFFGWRNTKWFIREVRKIYSNEKSYFSKKRMESGAAFTVAQWGAITWFIVNLRVMTIDTFLLWFGAQMIIVGYNVNKIQVEKEANGKTGN